RRQLGLLREGQAQLRTAGDRGGTPLHGLRRPRSGVRAVEHRQPGPLPAHRTPARAPRRGRPLTPATPHPVPPTPPRARRAGPTGPPGAPASRNSEFQVPFRRGRCLSCSRTSDSVFPGILLVVPIALMATGSVQSPL